MNGKERALAALSCKPTDHLSIFPSVDVAGAAKYLGEKVGSCFVDAELHARSLGQHRTITQTSAVESPMAEMA